MLGTIIGVSLVLFQCWPLALMFFILGGIATGIIAALTGHVVNYFLVLLIEYILMLLVLSIALYVVKKRRFD